MNHLALAIESIYAGNGQSALDHICDAMNHIDTPRNFSYAYLWRGYVLRENFKEDDSGLKDYDRASEYDPSNERTFFQRGTVLETYFDCPESALKDYERAIQLKPDYAVAINNRGALYRDLLKDYHKAIKDFDEVITLRPDFPNAYGHKALVYFLMGRKFEAEELVNKSLLLDAKYAFAHYVKGLLQKQDGKIDEAISSLERFLSLHPHRMRYRLDASKQLEELQQQKIKIQAEKCTADT